MSRGQYTLRARLPLNQRRLIAVPGFDHGVLPGDQAQPLAGFEAMIAGVAGMAAASEPDAAFQHRQFAAAWGEADRAAGYQPAGVRGRRGREGQQRARGQLRSHHQSPNSCAVMIGHRA
ncbi:MAG TPA: hypothetical protein VJO99_20460 [Burkholderiaceae bacterium]|nr:hypothetical protein [Burkholderiaceae bacterium]